MHFSFFGEVGTGIQFDEIAFSWKCHPGDGSTLMSKGYPAVDAMVSKPLSS